MLLRHNFVNISRKSMLLMLFILCFTSISLAQTWMQKAPMPTARGWLSTCTVDNSIYAIGGALDVGSNLDAVEAFDPLTNTWTTKTSMPTPRGCAAACAVDGIIYVFGGGWYTVHSTVEAYDPSTDTWTTKSPMPSARSALSVCVVDSIIYLISGFTDMNNPLSTTAVEAYDPKTDTWTTKAPIPTPRAFFSTSVVNGIIYTFGGFNREGAPSLGNVEAYDPVSDVWTIKNDMPNPRAGMASYTYGGNIYFFGGVGYGGGPTYSTINKYDPASDTWEEFSNMPYAAFSISNSPLNGKVYFIGGLNTARTPLSVVYEYTPPATSNVEAGDVSGTWTKANSPYNINGEITIPNDSTLTIEPGVEVVFTGNYKFNVQGRLLALGTETDTILFTINDTTGFYDPTIPDGGWGGIRFIDASPNNDSSKILYCKLQYGKANTGDGYYDRWGGALCAKVNKLLVSHCMFRKNTCYHTIYGNAGGGAIAIVGNPVIEFCEFSENTSPFGGAMMIWGSNLNPLIRNNYFHNNQGHGIINIGSWGGSNTSPIFINNIFVNNNSIEDNSPAGHGIINISNGGGLAVLINNTLINNSGDISGSALCVHLTSATPLLINNIIYGNIPAQVRLNVTNELDFYNCLIEGGREGFTGASFTGTYENCIDVDPLLVSSNDFHLQNTSPCIGAGIDSILIGSQWYYSPLADFEGNPRPNPSGSMPDIGAFENELDSPAETPEWITYNTTNSDMPSDSIYCIEIDELGNKWIGTRGGGLAKFNGSNWTIYNTSNSGLPDNYISSIVIDRSGSKWIVTGDGLVIFDGTTWTVYNTSNSGLPNNRVICIAIDEDGNKWIGTEEGLIKFDGINWTIYNTSNSGLPENYIGCIAIDKQGNKWIGGGADFVRFDDTTWTVYDIPIPDGYYGMGSIVCMTIDNAGSKWIGVNNINPFTWGGLISYDDTTFTIYDDSTSGLQGGLISCIDIDEFDNKWIGTWYGSLAKLDDSYPGGAGWTVYNVSDSGLPSNRIDCIDIDKFGNKWIGTWGGLAVFNEGGIVTEVEQENIPTKTPTSFVLYQNYPNPFNPSTTIKYSIPVDTRNEIGDVRLIIYDILGREVATLVNEKQKPGNYEVEWNASEFPSGVYFYQLTAGAFVETKKLILIK